MRTVLLSASLFLYLLISGCQPRKECFYFPETWHFQFKVIDQETGLDAFFSPNPVYDVHKTKAIDVLSEGSSPKLSQVHSGGDEYLKLSFKRVQTGILLQYNENEADTLEIKYNFEHAECCPELTGYDVMVNNEVLCLGCGSNSPAIITR